MEELPKLANGIGPMGLARMGAPITEMPAKDQQALGLRLGDMVMVLDGYRVLNDPQYAVHPVAQRRTGGLDDRAARGQGLR